MRKSYTRSFVGWDGEGANDKYILLRNSRGRFIGDINGLSTTNCLDFILQERRYDSDGTKHVIFSGGYDVNMMLCDVDRKTLWTLWNTGKVKWKQYQLSYIPRKTFAVSVGKTVMTLWDVFGFFQGSFVHAIEEWLREYDQTQLSNIKTHKADRNDFRIEDFDDINTYCSMEIDALVQIMEKLEKHARDIDIRLTRYDGAGAIAAALLHKYKIKEHMKDFEVSDYEMHKEAWRAYAGGRIEACKYGYHKDSPIWHGDINSAYPTTIRTLPSFRDGAWEYTTTFRRGVYGLWRVRFDFTCYPQQAFYPFFYREPHGRIVYPWKGQGSYWSPEVEAALDTLPNGVEIEYGWIWNGEKETPFNFVDTIYAERQRLKKEGNAAQIILKLGMNSMYGKLAQQIGWKHNVKPAYQQIEWAGFITSNTRATLYRVASQHADSVICYCTDGLYSLETHTVPEGKKLGEWDVTTHDEMILAQSGVYWTKDSGVWHDKTRGYDKEQIGTRQPLDSERVLTAYRTAQWSISGTCTRFIGMGYALQHKNQWGKWRRWDSEDRNLLLIAHGSKRVDIDPWWDENNNPSQRMFATLPLISEYAHSGEVSAIYKKQEAKMEKRKIERDGSTS